MNKLIRAGYTIAVVLALAMTAPAYAQTAKPAPAPPVVTTPTAKPAAPATKTTLLDINRASDKEIAELPGINATTAAAIVKNRPYKRKDELVRKNVVPQNVYDNIKEKIIAKQ